FQVNTVQLFCLQILPREICYWMEKMSSASLICESLQQISVLVEISIFESFCFVDCCLLKCPFLSIRFVLLLFRSGLAQNQRAAEEVKEASFPVAWSSPESTLLFSCSLYFSVML